MNPKSELTFHNVGQGLFFSANLDGKNIIYDCGSKSVSSVLQASINAYDLKNPAEIDLLIISHLHQDHCNGIPLLLNNHTIKRVVIPYYSPFERLIARFDLKENGNKDHISEDYQKELEDFILEPYDFLMKKGVEEIYVVKNSAEESNYKEAIFDKRDKFTSHAPFEKVDDISINLQESSNLISNIRGFNDQVLEGVRYCSLDGELIINNWHIIPYNNPLETDKLLHLSRDISKCLDSMSLTDLLGQRQHRKVLKEAYKNWAFADINETSIVLGAYCLLDSPGYTGTAEYTYGRQSNGIVYASKPQYKQRIQKLNGLKFGFMLTGDIKLKRNIAEIRRKYQEFYDINLFQVPHHGSANNWYHGLSITPELHNVPIYIIPTGHRYGCNNYRHFNYIHPFVHFVDKMMYHQTKLFY